MAVYKPIFDTGELVLNSAGKVVLAYVREGPVTFTITVDYSFDGVTGALPSGSHSASRSVSLVRNSFASVTDDASTSLSSKYLGKYEGRDTDYYLNVTIYYISMSYNVNTHKFSISFYSRCFPTEDPTSTSGSTLGTTGRFTYTSVLSFYPYGSYQASTTQINSFYGNMVIPSLMSVAVTP